MIRMFISDLDGTLLNNWHIADKTINRSIEEIDKRGYHFAVATGRHLRKHQRFGLAFLKNTHYIITMNGALVTKQDGRVINQRAIDSRKIVELQDAFPAISFEYLSAEKTFVKVSRFKHFIAGFKGFPTFKNIGRALMNACFGNFTYRINDGIIKNNSILKIECIVNSLEEREQLITYLTEQVDYFSYAFNDEVHFEITAKGVNKKEGILLLLKEIGVHPDRVAVYGNDSNDVEMLAYFVHSYAPESARPIAKEAAKYLIGNANEHSVVTHMLETMKAQDAYKPNKH